MAAGFTPSLADRLRRSLARFKRIGNIGSFRDQFVSGMQSRGDDADFAARCFAQIEGFGSYSAPKAAPPVSRGWFIFQHGSNATIKQSSPARFRTVSRWGFTPPAQLLRDARDSGVDVCPISVNHSLWDWTLELCADGALALQLGFRQSRACGQRTPTGSWPRAAMAIGPCKTDPVLSQARFHEPVIHACGFKNHPSYSSLTHPKSKGLHALLVIAKLSVFAIGKPIGVQFVFRDINPNGIVHLVFSSPCLVVRARSPRIRSGR